MGLAIEAKWVTEYGVMNKWVIGQSKDREIKEDTKEKVYCESVNESSKESASNDLK